MVGAVIVSESGEVLGEGFHEAYGEAHAEVNAVRDALSRGHSLQATTIYISLEPCAHQGKTPPCVDLILKHGFSKLVFASYDPNPLVSGKGLGKLARTEIITPDNLEPEIVREAEYLNRAFFKTIKRESWVTAKIALTLDGRMITRSDEPRWITNTHARRDVHLMRASHQAVITGTGTVRADDPQLNVRYSAEELGIARVVQPRRIVLTRDTELANNGLLRHACGIPRNDNALDPHNDKQRDRHAASRLAMTNDDVGSLPPQAARNDMRVMNGSDLRTVISELRQEGITKLMLEAGPTLTQAFLDAGLVDELVVYQPLSADIEQATKRLKTQVVDCFGITATATKHGDCHVAPSALLAMTEPQRDCFGATLLATTGEPGNIKLSLLF